MGLTAFPHGVSSFGMPVIGAGPYVTTGNVFFVDSGATNASDGNAGTSPDKALATIDAAVGKCTANNGDIIFVMPGHVDTISTATSLVVDVAGVQIIGLGVGKTRPILDFTATAGSVELDAANCRLSNFVLRANVSAVVVAVNVDANDIEIDHIQTTFDATGDDFITILDIDAVDDTYVHDCNFVTELTAGADEAIRLDTATRARIVDCRFFGQWAVAAIVAEGALSAGIEMNNLIIYNADTSVYNGIDMGTLSVTGVLANTQITALYTTAVAKIFRDGDLSYHNLSLANAVSEYGAKIVGTSAA